MANKIGKKPSVKRQNGLGTVFQRADGKWVAAVTDPLTGKQKRKYAKTENEANVLLQGLLQRVQNGLPAIDATLTVKAFAQTWLKERAALRRAPATVNEYASRLTKHVYPVIGNKRLDRVTTRDIEHVLDVAASNGLSKTSVRSLRNAIAALFADAVKDRSMGVNPASQAQLPMMQQSPSKAIPSTSEINQLIKAISQVEDDEQVELGRILLLLISTGARIGEVLAMTWSDIDFAENVWLVKRTITRDINGRLTVGNRTKTGETRNVLLADTVMSLLQVQRKYVLKQRLAEVLWTKKDWVFPTSIGTVKDPNNLRKVLKDGFPQWNYSFHAIRHWFASLGLSSGAGDTQMARLLGHKTTRTTKDIYGHLLDEGSATIIDMVQRAIGNE